MATMVYQHIYIITGFTKVVHHIGQLHSIGLHLTIYIPDILAQGIPHFSACDPQNNDARDWGPSLTLDLDPYTSRCVNATQRTTAYQPLYYLKVI